MESIDDRIQHVSSSIHFTGHALKELYTILNLIESEVVVNTIHKPPFVFYRVSLTYVIVTEYYKLFEFKKDKYPKLSSIKMLIAYLEKDFNSFDQKLIMEFNSILISLEENNIHKKIIKLRLKKISHSDQDDLNKPWNIPIISKDEIIKCYNNLIKIDSIINQIERINGRTYISLEDFYKKTRTHNEIIWFAISKQYYLDHRIDAEKKGYDILKQTLPRNNN